MIKIVIITLLATVLMTIFGLYGKLELVKLVLHISICSYGISFLIEFYQYVSEYEDNNSK